MMTLVGTDVVVKPCRNAPSVSVILLKGKHVLLLHHNYHKPNAPISSSFSEQEKCKCVRVCVCVLDVLGSCLSRTLQVLRYGSCGKGTGWKGWSEDVQRHKCYYHHVPIKTSPRRYHGPGTVPRQQIPERSDEKASRYTSAQHLS